MSAPWDGAAKAALSIVQEALKGFVERREVDSFACERTALFAREWYLARRASSDSERADHVSHLEYLLERTLPEARRLPVSISVEAKDTVGRVLFAAGLAFSRLEPALRSAA